MAEVKLKLTLDEIRRASRVKHPYFYECADKAQSHIDRARWWNTSWRVLLFPVWVVAVAYHVSRSGTYLHQMHDYEICMTMKYA